MVRLLYIVIPSRTFGTDDLKSELSFFLIALFFHIRKLAKHLSMWQMYDNFSCCPGGSKVVAIKKSIPFTVA